MSEVKTRNVSTEKPRYVSNGAPRYTYDTSKKLGGLIPKESMTNRNNDVNVPQTTIDKLRTARNEPTWTKKDVGILRAAALCRLNHFYRALVEELAVQGKKSTLLDRGIDREAILFKMMTGLSAREAFRNCCGDVHFPG